jgi:hypothetical protein
LKDLRAQKVIEQNRDGFLALEFSLSVQTTKVCLIRVSLCPNFSGVFYLKVGLPKFILLGCKEMWKEK